MLRWSLMGTGLTVIESCDCCGACCGVVGLPPFVRHLDGTGEEAWDRLRWDRPDLRDALVEAERLRQANREPTIGAPCLWYDAESRRCRHHESRPSACRAFAVGGPDCRDSRRRAGMA